MSVSINTEADQGPNTLGAQIISFEELPLPFPARRITDICCIVLFAVFTVSLLIASIAMANGSNLSRSQAPADSNGIVCLTDTNGQYPYLYFDNTQRVCLASCPQKQIAPKCLNGCLVGYYPNVAVTNSMGQFCLPTDPTLQQQLLNNSGIIGQWNALQVTKYLLLSLLFGVLFATILTILVYLFSEFMVKAVVALAIISLLCFAIVLFLSAPFSLSQSKSFAILVAVFSLILGIMLTVYACSHSKQLEVCSQFLNYAGTIMGKDVLIAFVVFLLISIGFGFLMIFQYEAMLSSNQLNLPANSMYYQLSASTLQGIALIIQCVWGLSFIRDAYYYLVAAWAVQSYFGTRDPCQPVSLLFHKNIGSVISGSFLNGFLYFPALFVSLVCPTTNHSCCNALDLVRPQAYAYIYLTGNSYCESVRQSQYLCQKSSICRENESVMSLYGLCARVVVAVCTVLVVFGLGRAQIVENVSGWLLVGTFFVVLYICSFVVDAQVIAADALALCCLAEYQLERDENFMSQCPAPLRQIIMKDL